MRRYFRLTLLFILILAACEDDTYTFRVFPGDPENMYEFNSEFDDYNSYLEVIGDSGPLCFSSKRNSDGDNFDLIYKILAVYMTKSRDGVRISVSDNDEVYGDGSLIHGHINRALDRVNSSGNEMGPYLVPQGYGIPDFHSGLPDYDKYILLYASDKTGDLDIMYTDNTTEDLYSMPKEVNLCNSPGNDAYPCVFPDSSSIYFCSDRANNFDIYMVRLDAAKSFLSSLDEPLSGEVTRVTELSSDYNDKCPFITGNLMVFVSDRPGGFGGFDLYYSLYNGTSWNAPVNFGKKINSAYDEYRPIVKNFGSDFINDFMIFSSNRPGGLGGFDLYYAGIDRMTE
jgi:hypothetical protein